MIAPAAELAHSSCPLTSSGSPIHPLYNRRLQTLNIQGASRGALTSAPPKPVTNSRRGMGTGAVAGRSGGGAPDTVGAALGSILAGGSEKKKGGLVTVEEAIEAEAGEVANTARLFASKLNQVWLLLAE